MQGNQRLDGRGREVLALILRQYIANGLPVGSKAVADQLPEPLSSATVRNIMADLEAAGFLEQPHISAGRVPTDKGYRFYVDHIAASTRLGPTTEKYIDECLTPKADCPDELMARTSRILAEVSENVGLVLAPALEEKLLEQVKFVKLPDRRVLAVIVSRPDLIENKVVRLNEDVSQEELDQAADYLNTDFRGWSLRTIRVEVFKRIEEARSGFDRLLANVATLFLWGALAGEDAGPLFLDVAAKIFGRPEFMDVRKVKDLMVTFEQKAKLVKILSACLDTTSPGVRVLIGRENQDSAMHQCTIVVAAYRYRNRAVGALGVVGPTRMHYDRAINTVEYVARLTSRLLSLN